MTRRAIHLRGVYDRANLGDDLTATAFLLFMDEFAAQHGRVRVVLERQAGALEHLLQEFDLAHLDIEYVDDLWDAATGGPAGGWLRRSLRRAGRLAGLALRLAVHRFAGRGGVASSPLPDVAVLHYAGGGYLRAADPRTFIREWIIRTLMQLANPELRVVGSGLGVGPAPGGTHWLFRAFFRGFDVVSFRDAASAALAGHDRSTVLGDDAFLAAAWIRSVPPSDLPPGTVGLHLRAFEHVSIEGLRAVGGLVGQCPSVVTFVLASETERRADLLPAADRGDGQRQVDAYRAGLRGLVAAIKGLDRAVGTAFHFCVLCQLAGVPVLGLHGDEAYRQKMLGLVESVPGMTPVALGDGAEAAVAAFLQRPRAELPRAAAEACEATRDRLARHYEATYRRLLGGE